jgi:hypothetical protein
MEYEKARLIAGLFRLYLGTFRCEMRRFQPENGSKWGEIYDNMHAVDVESSVVPRSNLLILGSYSHAGPSLLTKPCRRRGRGWVVFEFGVDSGSKTTPPAPVSIVQQGGATICKTAPFSGQKGLFSILVKTSTERLQLV